jgi:hypothetical protein
MQKYASLTPLRIILSIIMVIGIGFFILVSGVLLALNIYGEVNSPGAMRIQLLAQSLALFLTPPIILMYALKLPRAEFLAIKAVQFKRSHLLYFALIVVGSLLTIDLLAHLNEYLIQGAQWAQSWIKEGEEIIALQNELLSNMTPATLLANGTIFVVVPAIGEELFFRGMLQGLFTKRLNHHMAIFLTASIFSVIHWQIFNLLPILFMGVLFGYIKHWTQSIWIPIGLHFINNGLALAGAYIANGESLDESTVAGSSWSYLGVLFVLAGLYGVYVNRRT